MLPERKLRVALQSVPPVAIGGPWVRAIDARLLQGAPPGEPEGSQPQPLWGGGARLHGGRFTPRGSFDTLYVASDLATLGLEIGSVLGAGKGVSRMKDPFTVVHVDGRMTHVLDLRDGTVLEALGTTVDEMTGSWRVEVAPPTHRLGMAAHESERFCAIVAPSAKRAGKGFILAVFTDRIGRFPPSFFQSIDTTGRLAQRIP
jgi:RES domain-containing protein